jgi:carboxymethylenebutenolidase
VNVFQEYFIHEFVDDYKEGHMSRRDMVRRVLYITGGVASTASVLLALGCGPSATTSPTAAPAAKPTEAPKPSPAAAASPAASPSPSPAAVPSPAAAASPSPSPAAASPLSVPANDPNIETADITFPSEGATIQAYQAKPRGSGPFPVVLVCHENRGLVDHIRDVARRFAREGYVGCAVDLLSREGGTNRVADPAQVPGLLSNAPPERHVADFQAAVRHYSAQPFVRPGTFAMIGFCFGGGITWRGATKITELKAASPWYGVAPPAEDVPGIKSAVLGVYAADDERINASRDAIEPALRQANVTYQFKTYPNTRHAFNNDTGANYNQEQALIAWRDVLDWFGRYVRS